MANSSCSFRLSQEGHNILNRLSLFCQNIIICQPPSSPLSEEIRNWLTPRPPSTVADMRLQYRPKKNQNFTLSRVCARSPDVSPDIHYSICSDLHLPNLPTASCRLLATPVHRCMHWPPHVPTNHNHKNLSSLLRLH